MPWAVPPAPCPPSPCLTGVPWPGCGLSLPGLTPGPVTGVRVCTCYPRHAKPLSPGALSHPAVDLEPPPAPASRLQDPHRSALLPSRSARAGPALLRAPGPALLPARRISPASAPSPSHSPLLEGRESGGTLRASPSLHSVCSNPLACLPSLSCSCPATSPSPVRVPCSSARAQQPGSPWDHGSSFNCSPRCLARGGHRCPWDQ